MQWHAAAARAFARHLLPPAPTSASLSQRCAPLHFKPCALFTAHLRHSAVHMLSPTLRPPCTSCFHPPTYPPTHMHAVFPHTQLTTCTSTTPTCTVFPPTHPHIHLHILHPTPHTPLHTFPTTSLRTFQSHSATAQIPPPTNRTLVACTGHWSLQYFPLCLHSASAQSRFLLPLLACMPFPR